MNSTELDSGSRSVLGIMAFIYPDSIPQELFETETMAGSLASLSISFASLFSRAADALLALDLIARNNTTRTFSILGPVQDAFKSHMTASERERAFSDAVVLVAGAFPRRDSAVAQLYSHWDRCAIYLPDVFSLKKAFCEEKTLNPGFTPPQIYCELNNMCQRYLLELHSDEQLLELIIINEMVFASLPSDQQAVGLHASLTSHKGQLLCRLGKPKEGIMWLTKSHNLRIGDVPFNPLESAWAADNLASGFATDNDLVEAMVWYDRAKSHYQQWAAKQGVPNAKQPQTLLRSRAEGLVWSGYPEEARRHVTEALEQINSTVPHNWAAAARAHFVLGTIDRHERQFDAAESQFMTSQILDNMRSHPVNGACVYRLGCIALDKGKIGAAM